MYNIGMFNKKEYQKEYMRQYQAKKRNSVPGRKAGRPPSIMKTNVEKHNKTTPIEIAGIVNGQPWVVFTPNNKKTPEQLKEVARLYDNRYLPPTIDEIKHHP